MVWYVSGMTQLKRENWLKHGLFRLAEHGVSSLTIDALCKQFGVTKGSFYHHFKSHKAYLTAVLQYWQDEYTSRFIEHSEEGETVAEKMQRLDELVMQNFGDYEVHIRAWAQADPLAREFQARVDQRRIDYLFQLYQVWLEDDDQARAMAHLVYTTLIGSTAIIPSLDREDYTSMMALVAHLAQTLMREDGQS